MIGSEAPVVIAKACELFIRELTLQAWMHTEENKRRTLQVRFSAFLHSYLQKVDITTSVSNNEMYDFLIDFIPREEHVMDYHKNAAMNPYDNPMMFSMFVRELLNFLKCRMDLLIVKP